MDKSIRLLLLLFWIFGAINSCKTVKQTQTDHDQIEKENNNIIFLSLRISRNDAFKESVEVIKVIWADGALKEKGENEKRLNENMLVLEFLDGDKNFLKRILAENPLLAHLEYFSPEGEIQRKEADLKEATFTIRTEISRSVAYLDVSNAKGQKISFIELK